MNCPICKSSNTCFFAEIDSYIFYRCKSCKILFLTSLPTDNKLDRYYSKQFSYTDGFINEMVIRKRSKIIIQKLHELSPNTRTICDVGSGYGFFLDECKQKGYKVIGVEPSHILVRHAIKKYSISTFEGTLTKYLETNPNQFDIVTCIHVIEHVINPKLFVSELFKIVKPGGILYIETPNSDSHLLYAEQNKYTFLIPPEHLWIFSRFSFSYLFPKGLDIIHINTYSFPEHFMGILKSIYSPRVRNSINTTNIRIFVVDNNTTKLNPLIQLLVKLKKKVFYLVFDCMLAPIFTATLNLHHKGSILELYIRKK